MKKETSLKSGHEKYIFKSDHLEAEAVLQRQFIFDCDRFRNCAFFVIFVLSLLMGRHVPLYLPLLIDTLTFNYCFLYMIYSLPVQRDMRTHFHSKSASLIN